jgi:pimeloyl-ACP methyl ester carboxylesterase
VTQVVGMSDDREVTVDSLGAPDGAPVFLLHGTPGCRAGPRPRPSVLYRLGIRLICYDRPGYGGSDPHPGRTVADAAWDVLEIADALKLDSFSVVGRSGGGPHALACAALLEERVRSAAVLVGLAPADAEDLDWYAGMSDSNVDEYKRADSAVRYADATVRASLRQRAENIRDDPESLLRFLDPQLTGPDRRIVVDASFVQLLTDTYAEAVRVGADGWIDDVLAFRRPWGFDPSKVKVPVLLWHGEDDMFSPVGHTHWLHSRVPGSILEVQTGAAHFGAMEILPSVLAWAKEAARSEGLRIQSARQPEVAAQRGDVGMVSADQLG